MALTVRLEPELDARIAQASRRKGVTKSEWVRQALTTQLEAETALSPYEIYLQVTRDAGLDDESDRGPSDLSTSHRRILREKLRAKHRR